MTKSSPFLDIVVTARPSWARVKSLLVSYVEIAGLDRVRLSLTGPALSNRYGDLTALIPNGVSVKSHSTLRESDDLASIALTCLDGSQALVHQWSESRPDCVLVVADRTETLGVSAAATLMQIPLIHLQGGEISGSIDDKIRDVNSKLADLHLTTNYDTKKYLENMGENPDSIFIVGCPSIDIVKEVISKPLPTFQNLGGVGKEIDVNSEYGIVMFHPDTLEPQSTLEWAKAITDVIDNSHLQWFWFWPNPDHGTNLTSKVLRTAREQGKLKNVRFIINIPPEQFIELACKASIMVGNSSFGIREASFIGLPVLNIGNRQSGRQRASNVTDMPKPRKTEFEFKIQHLSKVRFPKSEIYGSGNAGRLSAEIISSWSPKIKSRPR